MHRASVPVGVSNPRLKDVALTVVVAHVNNLVIDVLVAFAVFAADERQKQRHWKEKMGDTSTGVGSNVE
jgi:hypothetical protein